jgi:hypothetical protein
MESKIGRCRRCRQLVVVPTRARAFDASTQGDPVTHADSPPDDHPILDFLNTPIWSSTTDYVLGAVFFSVYGAILLPNMQGLFYLGLGAFCLVRLYLVARQSSPQ